MEEKKTLRETMLQLLSKLTDAQKQELFDFMSKLEADETDNEK